MEAPFSDESERVEEETLISHHPEYLAVCKTYTGYKVSLGRKWCVCVSSTSASDSNLGDLTSEVCRRGSRLIGIIDILGFKRWWRL